ncbi:heavy-metal-associated domain-containing protein [Uliginosibacterium sp. H1]|uniref:heavy-metal-associated domain-containing protein n=1 Tax=Uliginosibacterium sp. H1 TaxID=3114757 RepID=UPI002E172A78|nr:heavy-metal-associated domain-containing protein [Uliginosibacterium sp. H1]
MTLPVQGMTCGGCSAAVTRVLSGLPGVAEVTVSLPQAQATVRFDPEKVGAAQLAAAVRDAGYEVPA